jgi:hypothetical protein
LIENVYGLQDLEPVGTEYVKRGPGRPSSSHNRPVEPDKGYLMSTGDANSGTEASGKQQDDLQDVQKDARDRANKKKQIPGS